LWVGSTTHGLYRFDRHAGTFTQAPPLMHDSLELYRPGNQNARSLFEDNDGIVWIGTDHALNSFNPHAGSVARFLVPSSDLQTKQPLQVYSISGGSDSTLWLGTQRGLYSFNKRRNAFIHIPITDKDLPVYAVCLKSENELWIGTEDRGALRLDASGKIVSRLLDTEDVCTIHDDGRYLWFGTVSGKVLMYDERTGQGQSIHYTEPAQAVHQITAIVRDESGVALIGTVSGGLYKLTPKKIEFTLYRFAQSGKNVSPALRAVWSIAELHDRTILLGTGKGFAILDAKDEVYRTVTLPSARLPVRAILEEKNIVYAGLLDGGIARWNRGTNAWNQYTYDPGNKRYYGENNVYCLLNDRHSNLWAGTNGGFLERFDKMKGTLSSYDNGRWDKWILSLCEDRMGRIWVGTWASGIAEFDRNSGTFTYHTPFPLHDSLASSDRVSTIHASVRDSTVLWLGTLGSGLLRFNTETKQFAAYGEHDGLPNSTIYGILEDDFGNLWMSTNKGISRFDPRTKSFTNFDVSDGLQGNEFNLGAYLKGSDGTLYFGGDNGVNSFKPESDVDAHPPKIFLTGIRVFGAPMEFDIPLSEVPAIELDYNRNQLTFEFIGLQYNNPRENQYAYTLEGYDSVWNTIGTKRDVSFARLEPGEYVFKVKAANSDGVWSEAAAMNVHIARPIWKQKLPYIILILALLLICYAVYRYKLNIEIRRALELERVRNEVEEHSRQRLQRSVHDQLAGQAAHVARKVEDLLDEPDARNPVSLHEISESVSMLINQLRNLNWQIDPTKDSLFDLLSQLKHYGENLFLKTPITFVLAGVRPEYQEVRLPVEWREELLLMFEEAMNNVFKHGGPCTSATLAVAWTDGLLELCLTDNGQGFDEEQCAWKNGLLHIRERASLLAGTLTVRSGKGRGTEICFSGKLPSGRV
jgi:ligand-binding sensor domain-containing protein/signal transduction histidine kinase